MNRNIEIKAELTVDQFDRIRGMVEELEIKPERLEQRDTYFDVDSGRLKLREFADGTAELIAYWRPDQQQTSTSRYIRTPIVEPDLIRQSLQQCCGLRGVVSKRRFVFIADNTRIHLDEVERLGCFLELEVVLDQGDQTADGELIAREWMRRLGIEDHSLVADSYIDRVIASAV